MSFDKLDKKIIQCLSAGTSSYEEIARQCNVTRNTVYRRITVLEEKGIIKNTLRCIVNLEKMDITAVNIGAKISLINQDRAVALLSINKHVRFLWRSYGDHNLTLIAFCNKGKEGEVINELRSLLENLGAEDFDISIGYVWEKMSIAPFEEDCEKELYPMIIEGT